MLKKAIFSEVNDIVLLNFFTKPNLYIKIDGKYKEVDDFGSKIKIEFNSLVGKNLGEKCFSYNELNIDKKFNYKFNTDIKDCFIKNMNDETVDYFSRFFVRYMPSKDSEKPFYVVNDDKLRNRTKFFITAYQAANYPLNGLQYSFDSGKSSNFKSDYSIEVLGETYKEIRKYIPTLFDSNPKLWDYNCVGLLSDSDVSSIKKLLTPDQFSYELSRLLGIYMALDDHFMKSYYASSSEIGIKEMPKSLANTAKHYLATLNAINSVFERLGHNSTNIEGDYSLDRMTANYLSSFYSDWVNECAKRRGLGEDNVLEYILNNPVELDDFLWSGEALDFAIERRKKIRPKSAEISKENVELLKKMQKAVLEITDKIDILWQKKYESNNVLALKERFGHPVGIPEKNLNPWHFLYGGFLIESGFIHLDSKERKDGLIRILNMPVDENGKPSPNTLDCDEVKVEASIHNIKSIDGLGKLAEACASGNEAWHVLYNRGLPKDSLYMAAALSNPDSHTTGSSYDDITGTVLGEMSQVLKSITFAKGESFLALPTATSKVVAISKRHIKNRDIAPNGTMSLKEIDLTNWRLTRLSDIFCGNEYGLSEKTEKSPYNFDKLSRKYHEDILNKIRNMKESDGIITYGENSEEMFRIIVGKQRAESYRLFVEKPGSYLRRTAKCLHDFNASPAAATYEQVSYPLTPTLAFRDTLTGDINDGTNTASPLPGTLSLFPQHFCPKASGTINYGSDLNIFPIENFNKIISVGPGRRGENFPRRIRFAGAKSFNEIASRSGALSPNFSGSTNEFLIKTVQIYGHLQNEAALITKDKYACSEVLKKAIWHCPEIWVQDYELGELGEAYLICGGESDLSRKLFLQSFIYGKYSERHKYTGFPSYCLTTVMGFSVPADPLLLYGNLKSTGEFHPFISNLYDKDKSLISRQGHIRKLGNHISDSYMYRPSGMFFARPREESDSGAAAGEGLFYKESDELIPRKIGVACLKGGYLDIGLNDTPIFFSEDFIPYNEYASFVDGWVDLVYSKGLKGEYERYDIKDDKGHIFNSPTLFKKNYERVKSQIQIKDEEVIKAIVVIEEIFGHPCRYRRSPGLWDMSKSDIEKHNNLMKRLQNK